MIRKTTPKYMLTILIGLLSFLALFLHLIHLMTENESPVTFLTNVIVSFSFAIVIAWLDYKFIEHINTLERFKDATVKRILFEAFCLSLLAVLFVTIGNIPFQMEGDLHVYFTSINYERAVVASILFNVFSVVVIDFFVQTQRHQALQQENTRIQYQQLKNQINPHFLFNSINVLVSLINIDSKRATDYAKKLSNVYRYVLTHDLEDTITISSELGFIRNYAEILTIRFGEGLRFAFDVQETDMQRNIPPMALQVLVENAVKHNIITTSKPLDISISSNGEVLTVANNLNLGKRVGDTTGIGLHNLQKKYAILTNKPIAVEQDDTVFTIKLPLL